MEPSPPRPGLQAAEGARLGPYVLVRPLGRGGGGEVWEAVLHGPGGFRKPVALKVLSNRLLEDPEAAERLAHEARLGARLQHPNVVGTLGLSQHGGSWVVALELVRGASVAELLGAGPLPPAAVLDVGVQTCAGLAHAHEAGLVHRDVKPGNLLVDRSGVVKLADLGVSAVAGAGAGVAGTWGYMPPEQLDGRADPRSDQFALGVTLYLLATRTRPFGSGEEARRAVREVERALAAPAFLAPVEAAVPGLGEVVRRCLRADPDLRWRDARALGDALATLRSAQAPGPGLLGLLARARPGLVAEPTPSVASSEVPTRVRPSGNLPPVRDRFVGRADDLRALVDRVLGGPGLVALLGPGGAGKTRLALEAARTVSPQLPGGAWAFDLTDATDGGGICAAVARGLGVALTREDGVRQLGAAFASRGRALVVLDNLEQCVDALPATLGAWLAEAPEATFLATSRVAPRLREAAVHVGPLGPADGAALFAERAGRPLAPEDAPDVAAICAAVDQLPLAIELAAARVRLLGVARVRQRLSLALLTGSDRDRPARHRSLEASLDASAELLAPEVLAGWHALAVFDGGFALEAAEAVLDAAGAVDALAVLEALVDASLLRVEGAGERFGMLLVVREYGQARCPPERRAAAELGHLRYFAQLGSVEAVQALDSPRGAALGRALAAEVPNLLAAGSRAVARGTPELALPILRLLFPLLERAGGAGSGTELARALVPALDGRAGVEAAALAARLCTSAGRAAEGVAFAETAVARAQALGDPRPASDALLARGVTSLRRGRAAEAGDDFAAAAEIFRALGDVRGLAACEVNHALVAYLLGDSVAAAAGYEAAFRRIRSIGAQRSEATVLGLLGNLYMATGRWDEAAARYDAALALHRAAQDARGEAVVLGNYGNLQHSRGRYDEAVACWERSLAGHRASGDRRSEGIVLGAMGVLEGDLGHREASRELHAAGLAASRDADHGPQVAVAQLNLALAEANLGNLDAARPVLADAHAAFVAFGDRRYAGIALGRLGWLELQAGDLERALHRLDAGDRLLREVEAPEHLAYNVAVRAEVLWRLGDPEGARAAYAEAERLAPAGSRQSEERLAELRALFAGPPAASSDGP